VNISVDFHQLLFAVIRAEAVLLIFIRADESNAIIINYCKTDRIGSHDVTPFFLYTNGD